MEPPPKPSSTSLFQVYLRLRPPPSPLVQLTQQSLYPNLPPPERYLTVEPAEPEDQDALPTHITIHPPSDSRKRAVEKFAFTKVFEEKAEQIDIFKGSGVVQLVEGVLGEARDGLVATLGVTGSGKSHTILGSKTQRGLTQLSLDLLYRSLESKILHPALSPSLIASLSATDPSEAQILSANAFLESVYGDGMQSHNASRAQTPMTVGDPFRHHSLVPHSSGPKSQWSILNLDVGSPRPSSPKTTRLIGQHSTCVSEVPQNGDRSHFPVPSAQYSSCRNTRNQNKVRIVNDAQDVIHAPSIPKRKMPQRPSALPQFPDISDLVSPVDSGAEYAIVVSMYEVYNDRIFDLLSIPSSQKDLRRRALLFKSTEASPDRKVVAGLRKIVCGTYEEALMVLETGLVERRVAGTGSNSVSSRSHGFFAVEVKRRPRGGMANSWSGAHLTVVDLAGSERARNAKTAGATLAEAGKINESLMYLGQCLQMQSDNHDNTKPSLVPFRQCKLTELLFSNSFPTANANHHHHSVHPTPHRNPQKAVMIVTADPLGDFNATSQILRYSALAREVTVPRIPSVSSTILAGIPCSRAVSGDRPTSPKSPTTNSGSGVDEGVVEMAFSELARLNEEVEILQLRLGEEERRRRDAEDNWRRAEERAESVEMDVREECWEEMERRLGEERRRWMGAWGEEADRNDEHLDRKMEILTKGIIVNVCEDAEDRDAYALGLERENESLRARVEALEREVLGRSPSKSTAAGGGGGGGKKARAPPPTSSPGVGLNSSRDILGSAAFKLNGLSLSPAKQQMAVVDGERVEAKTPATGKKMRKLTARKWDLMDENEMDEYENL